MRTPLRWTSWSLCSLLLLSGLFLTRCAHDPYRERADQVKEHTEAFYAHLKADRVEFAIRENEQIEAMAGEMGQRVRTGAAQQGPRAVEQEFALMKTAHEAAATNWLALGHYFAIKKQYPRARATYQRVVNTYTDPTDRAYREQAARALQDVDLLDPPPAATKNP
jgi:hypothetical protein